MHFVALPQACHCQFAAKIGLAIFAAVELINFFAFVQLMYFSQQTLEPGWDEAWG